MLPREHASAQKGLGDVAGSGTPEQRAVFQATLDALAADGTLSRSHSFDSADAAAKSVWALQLHFPQNMGWRLWVVFLVKMALITTGFPKLVALRKARFPLTGLGITLSQVVA